MKRKLAGVFLGLCLAVPGLVPVVYASSANIQEQQDEVDGIKDELSGANENLDYLEGVKEVLEVEKDAYENSVSELILEIEQLNDQIEQKEADIVETQKTLTAVKKDEKSQYTSMKQRIRYMYESGETNYVQIMLESNSIADFISNLGYVEDVTKYDRDRLNVYSDTRQEVEEQEKLLNTQQQELEASKQESARLQETMMEKLSVAKDGISEYSTQIEDAEAKALAYEEKLRQEEETLEGMKRREAMEQFYALGASGDYNTSGIPLGTAPATVYSADDLQLLAAIIECEAGGESYTGKVAVGNVVLDRVASPKYPNNIADVIYQKSQFTPVASGRFILVLSRGANAACTEAAKNAFAGERAVPMGTLYFHRVRAGESGNIIGNHIFY